MSNIAIILAAGKGTRMKSKHPKVMHEICGKSMLAHIIKAVSDIGINDIYTVIGHGADEVRSTFDGKCNFAIQKDQLGTGHAVMQGMADITYNEGTVLILCGDTPLIRKETLSEFMSFHHEKQASCTVMSAVFDDPFGYGRVIRNLDGGIVKIVEQKDASPEEQAITEVNSGIYCFDLAILKEALANLGNNNSQGEYYLTDTIAYCVAKGNPVYPWIINDNKEIQGINDRKQLANASYDFRMRKIEQLMASGVTFVDPASVMIDQDVEIGMDTVVEPFVSLRGKTVIGEDCVIGTHCDFTDSIIGDGNCIKNAALLEAKVGNNCNIGPFAYLRPKADLADDVKIGDFVEVKNTFVGEGSKIPHLTYVGDAIIEEAVNVGCGTITCNYDGINKHQTIIRKGAFIGSNASLVAPVEIGEGAIVGAGSVVTKNVPDNALMVERNKQFVKEDWATAFRSVTKKIPRK